MSLTQPLNASVDGQPIAITQAASTGDLLHTGKRGRVEMIRLVVSNRSGGALVLVLEWGTKVATQLLEVSIPANSLTELPDIPFTGGDDASNLQTLNAYCGTPNELAVVGEVRAL